MSEFIMRIPQTHDELRAHLAEQLGFLSTACSEFDKGKSAYAKLAATAIRVLLHDTRSSHSLLEQLGVKSQIPFLDTAGQLLDTNLASTTNLTVQRVTVIDNEGRTAPSYLPVLDDYSHRTRLNRPTAFGLSQEPAAGRRLPFEEWWTMTVIRDGFRTDFSRRDLVLALSNQDGGAHVDPEIHEAYHRLSRANSSGWVAVGAGDETPFSSPVPASVRQISHEFLRSIPRGWAR
ncbi:hypothetical protein QFZ65_000655 [Arthrobacter sp. B3I9]|uniref:hypothetical protein n=1 Tax=Arthrobacter sp. B3I9 TaxID=3042270 RepID=UPI0027947FC2|nr:hypothetical protein [Arthrobacter sp. B3I9]MDQ0848717.1 hypothetical protein [Arthrobacter sp. B3I9]